MILTDTKHVLDVVEVDAQGKPAADGEVEVKLYKVGWRCGGSAARKISPRSPSPASTPSSKASSRSRTAPAPGFGSVPQWGRY